MRAPILYVRGAGHSDLMFLADDKNKLNNDGDIISDNFLSLLNTSRKSCAHMQGTQTLSITVLVYLIMSWSLLPVTANSLVFIF